jgi:hypothetical protein
MSKIVNKCTAKAKVGRPTKYDKKYCEDVMKFFNIEPHFETPVTITYKDGTTKEEIKLIPSDLPTLASFASNIGIHRDTLNQWTKDHKEFSDAIKRAKEHQERILVTNGLLGLYQGAFAIFTAKNVIGWRDKTETDITSGGKPLIVIDTQPKI